MDCLEAPWNTYVRKWTQEQGQGDLLGGRRMTGWEETGRDRVRAAERDVGSRCLGGTGDRTF